MLLNEFRMVRFCKNSSLNILHNIYVTLSLYIFPLQIWNVDNCVIIVLYSIYMGARRNHCEGRGGTSIKDHLQEEKRSPT